jgi:hypothetical protein
MARNQGMCLAQRWAGLCSGLALVVGGMVMGCGEKSAPQPDVAAAGGAPGCEDDTDCGEGERCADGECIREGCISVGQTCSQTGRGVRTCAAMGEEETLVLCSGTERCAALEDGGAECRATACEAGQWTCADSDVAQRCSEDGSAVAEDIDCAELSQVCSDGACVPDDCGAECEPDACEPGQHRCAGDRVTECTADGAGFRPSDEDCAASGEVCFEGKCAPRVCEPQHVCHGNVSVSCVDNGTREESEPCGAQTGSFCNPSSGQCQPYVCVPGSAVCQGRLATRCADDGSGPLATGLDCSERGETCWDGGCAAVVCSAGFRCAGSALSRCGKAGSEWVPVMDCEAGTECDASAGACKPATCVPNAPVCRGGIATVCEASGVGYVSGGADCLAQGKTCLAGSCEPPVCSAGELFCAGKELRRCDDIGASSQLSDTCSESEICDAEQKACVPASCVPGSALCAGNVLTTCNAEGSGPRPGGQDCAAGGEVCELGECVAQICEPSLNFCGSGLVLLCNDAGTAAAPFTVCADGQHCAGVPGSAGCVTDSQKALL